MLIIINLSLCARHIMKHWTDSSHICIEHQDRITTRLAFGGLDVNFKVISDIRRVQILGRICFIYKVSKGAKIRSRYNQVPHLTTDTNGKVRNSQLDTINERQEVSPFLAVDHKAHKNRRAQRHSKHKTVQKT